MAYDCGFQKENNWFRYRAAAIIVEDDCILFAGNERENYYYSIGGGVKENMYWIPINELDNYKAFPTFMKDYLCREHVGIEHIVTDERSK